MQRDDMIGRSIAAQVGARIPIERPVLFSGSMVTAILEGRKTQTRRLVKRMALEWLSPPVSFTPEYVGSPSNSLCPYGVPGDRLWVRESFFNLNAKQQWPAGLSYRADRPGLLELGGQRVVWTPSIHMPRWASRITLEVVAVRIERLRAISEADAIAEGCRDPMTSDFSPGSICYASAVDEFELLWNSINGKRAHWGSDPWVWVVEFKLKGGDHG